MQRGRGMEKETVMGEGEMGERRQEGKGSEVGEVQSIRLLLAEPPHCPRHRHQTVQDNYKLLSYHHQGLLPKAHASPAWLRQSAAAPDAAAFPQRQRSRWPADEHRRQAL